MGKVVQLSGRRKASQRRTTTAPSKSPSGITGDIFAEAHAVRHRAPPPPDARAEDRVRDAALRLFDALIYSPNRTPWGEFLREIVDDLLVFEDGPPPGRIAGMLSDYFLRTQGWSKPSAAYTASRRAIRACAKLFNDSIQGKPINARAVRAFSEAANKIAPTAGKSRKMPEYIDLLQAVANMCDGTQDGLRLFVQFAILKVRGMPNPALAITIADKLWEDDLAPRSFRGATQAVRGELLRRVLRCMGVDTHGIENSLHDRSRRPID